MTVLIRPATPDDAAAMGAIWNPVIRDSATTFWPTERTDAEIADIIRDRRDSGFECFVGERDGQVLGFGYYVQFRGGFGYSRCMEHTIYIDPATHGAGLGRQLMQAIEDHARNAGRRLMIGVVTGANEGSIEFHRRLGYAEWGRIPAAGWKFGEWHDAVFMGKDLFA